MEYFAFIDIGFMVVCVLYGVFKITKMMFTGNHYTYVNTYDEEGMEVETVVDWSDQTNYKIKKDTK